MFYTYMHQKPDGTPFYVGKGVGNRFKDISGRSQYWNRVVKKYGGFKPTILAHWETEIEAFEHEKLLILCFKDIQTNLCNLTEGGEGPAGYKHTQEAKLKISFASANRKRKESTKEKIRKSQPKNKPCVVNGVEYFSVGEASRKLGFSQPTISRWLKPETKLPTKKTKNIYEARWV